MLIWEVKSRNQVVAVFKELNDAISFGADLNNSPGFEIKCLKPDYSTVVIVPAGWRLVQTY